jgi:hypothetical protein
LASERAWTVNPDLNPTPQTLKQVKRGPDWKWSSQDGGEGSVGVVVSGTDKNSDGWVRVRWPNGETNGYR